MVVLVRCPECNTRFGESNADPDEPVDVTCPNCEAEFTAAPEDQVTIRSAVKSNAARVLKRLIAAGADPNAGNALHLAADEGHPEVAKLLLKNGARIDATNKCGRTPLHQAASGIRDRTKTVKQLLEEGGTVDATDENGQTPLSVAVEYEDSEVAMLLVESGADVAQADMEAIVALQSPAVRAEVAAHREVPQDLIDLMVRAGSRPDLSGLSEGEPGPITETERDRLVQMGPYGKTLVAAHPDTPREELFELAEEAPKGFLQNPVLDAFTLEDPGWRQKMPATALASVLRVSDVPSRWLEEGAKHEDPEVRMAVAENENTSPDVLRELADDFYPRVRNAARENLAFPADASDG